LTGGLASIDTRAERCVKGLHSCLSALCNTETTKQTQFLKNQSINTTGSTMEDGRCSQKWW